MNLGSDSAAQTVLQRLDEAPEEIAEQWLNHLSGKVEKASLRRLGDKVKPRKRALQQQFDDLVQ